jgi:hypothetical protein
MMPIRPPSILDVVRAVKALAGDHGEVSAWWYAPPRRLRLAGEKPNEAGGRHVEIAIEGECDPATCDRIARQLSIALSGALRQTPVRVRPYRGKAEDARLYRLLSAGDPLPASG